MPSLADLVRMGKQYVSDALPGGSLNPEVSRQSVLDGAAMAASPVPILGDLIGLGADANRYATDPSSRTPLNYGLSALGALPFMPPMVGMFAGKGAKTADLAAQGMAAKMLDAGEDPAKVWSRTGWGIGPDGKWRFEIPDNAAKYGVPISDMSGQKLGDVYSHGDLMQAYPVGDIRLTKPSGSAAGHFNQASNELAAPEVYGKKIYGTGKQGKDAYARAVDSQNSTTLHELQHAIQKREGFARGGSPDTFAREMGSIKRDYYDQITAINEQLGRSVGTPRYSELLDMRQELVSGLQKMGIDDSVGMAEQAHKKYQSLGGEAEARLTQARMNMDAGQRASQYPWEPDYFHGATGVRLGDLINRFDDSGQASSLKDLIPQ